MISQINKSRLKGAVEAGYSHLQLAKSEAVMRNKKMNINIRKGANWCLGMTDQNRTCDCSVAATSASACTVDGSLKVVNGTDYPNVSLRSNLGTGSSFNFTFDDIRGMPQSGNTFVNGTMTYVNPDNLYISVVMSRLGMTRVCSNPNDTNPKGVHGYPQDCVVAP